MIGTKPLSTRRNSWKRKKREEIVESARAAGGLACQTASFKRKKKFETSKCHILKSTRYTTYVLKREHLVFSFSLQVFYSFPCCENRTARLVQNETASFLMNYGKSVHFWTLCLLKNFVSPLLEKAPCAGILHSTLSSYLCSEWYIYILAFRAKCTRYFRFFDADI